MAASTHSVRQRTDRGGCVGDDGCVEFAQRTGVALQSEYDHAALKDIVARYQHASTKRALWQMTNSFGPYLLLWYAMR
jgi:hypothetical protein